MAVSTVTEAVELLEKANSNLEPELLTMESARRLLDEYARAKKLASFGEAVLARRIDDASAVARATRDVDGPGEKDGRGGGGAGGCT